MVPQNCSLQFCGFFILRSDGMKHEDVPGYTELRAKLFQLRYQLQILKNDEEKAKVLQELKSVKKAMARAMYENEERKRGK